MVNEIKFDVRIAPEAVKEYNKLDGSILEVVNKQIDELEYRADRVGKMLENKNNSKLSGCKEIKLKDAGIRIIFRITNLKVEVLQIVYIIAIEKRSKNHVFNVANQRNKQFRKMKNNALRDYLVKIPEWKKKKKITKKKIKIYNKKDNE